MKNKSHELEEAQKRLDKLNDHIRASESQLDEQKKLLTDLDCDVGSSKSRIDELTASLDEVTSELGDARVDKHEDNRRKKKQEIVENFKRLFPGVFDRMINMSQPIHKKYNVAITKQLGRYMEAIVVDTEGTARLCIQYLKDQMLEPETFLPLDYIQAKPLKERLRNISHVKGVKLLYDVIKYDIPEIKRAILFVTNNSLVCETPEDAMKVAYEMEDGQRYDAVALDGTFYQKSGIISGGSVDLARKAKRWDDKQVSSLKTRKEKLSEELRVAMKNSRKESEIETIKKEMEKMRADLEKFAPAIRVIESSMRKREKEIEGTKEKMNTVEYRVFSEFCKKIGVKNIRQYEERELKSQQEKAKRKLEFENQINRITTQLEYERKRGEQLKTNVDKFERMVQDVEDQLESSKNNEGGIMKEIDKEMREVEKLKSEKSFLKTAVDEMDEEVEKARKEVSDVQKQLASISKEINKIEALLDNERSNRHTILKQCKMDSINIPMRRGRLEEIEDEDDPSIDVSSSQSSHVIYEKEERIKIDYSSLNSSLTEGIEETDVRRIEKRMEKIISDLMATIHRIQAPNMKAMQKLDEAREKLQEAK